VELVEEEELQGGGGRDKNKSPCKSGGPGYGKGDRRVSGRGRK